MAGPTVDYGFRFDESRSYYEVDEENMAVTRRIFGMIGAEGTPTSAMRKALESEGTPAPKGGEYRVDSTSGAAS